MKICLLALLLLLTGCQTFNYSEADRERELRQLREGMDNQAITVEDDRQRPAGISF